MKRAAPWAVIAAFAAGLAVGLLARRPAGGPDERYWIARDEYDQMAADMEAGLQETFRIIAERDKIIVGQEAIITAGQVAIAGHEATIAALRVSDADKARELAGLKTAEVEALLERYPALRAYDLAKDRLLEAKDKLVFTLTAKSADQARVIDAQAEEIVQLKYINASLRRALDDEHALRQAGDALRRDLERRYRSARLWAGVGKWGLPMVVGAGLLLCR